MVTVICEKTGLTFEAPTKRTKNHPSIMAIVNEANRDGWYAQALASLKAGREAGFTTLEEFIDLLNETREAAREQRNMRIDAYMDRKRANAEVKRQRYITNNILRSYGYIWLDLGYPEDEEVDNSYTGSLPRHDFQLKSPDGRLVSVKQAMIELATQQNVKVAREWLAERNIEVH